MVNISRIKAAACQVISSRSLFLGSSVCTKRFIDREMWADAVTVGSTL